MNVPIRKYYEEKIAGLNVRLIILKQRLRVITLLRLISFLMIFPSVFFLLPGMWVPGLLAAILFFIVFLLLIKTHLKNDLKYRHLRELLRINQRELQALDYRYDDFEAGAEYLDTNHPYSYDMDLFGPGSVFQFINRTSTRQGRDRLARLLSRETLDGTTIKQRQEAVKELAQMHDLVQDFQASGRINQENEDDHAMLISWLKSPDVYYIRSLYRILIYVLPAITLLSLLAAILNTSLAAIPVIFYFLQLSLVGLRLKHTNRNHQVISKRLEILRKYSSLLGVVEQGNYKGKELRGIYTVLISGQDSASRSIRSLRKIVSAFDNRLNILAGIVLQGFLMWDIQCMIRLEQWKMKRGSHLEAWIEAIAAFDALGSLSTYAFNHPGFIYPMPADDPVLRAESIGHILIHPEERICNDFEIAEKGKFILITGANMAGKSTFLRTIATNLILAMTGAPVCAGSMTFKPLALYSSMRTSDSLNKHESYFYAELKRLKDLLDRLRNGEELFIILDEILKGTNSTDKQKGSRAALQQIIHLGGTGIIATHDLALAALEKEYPDRVKNLCFEIDIDQAEISFDYKLREGITTRMNALLLMEQMGIIRDREDQVREK